VSEITAVVASAGGNVTDFSTRLTGDLYVLLAEVDLPNTADIDSLRARLVRSSEALDVEASLTVLDSDVM